MKLNLLMLTVLLGVLCGLGSPAGGVEVDRATINRITQRHPFTLEVERESDGATLFIYANTNQNIHVFSFEKGKLKPEWQSTNLGSPVTSILVRDLYRDGRQKLVLSTMGGRILIYELADYSFVWENLQDRFEKIECLAAANVDNDPQDEIVFVADSYLYIYDGISKGLEWHGQTELTAREILIANVDDDEQPEIILNSGIILDSKFYNVEVKAEIDFGERLSLIDLNGDGFLEIIGEIGEYSLRIFDIYAERVLY